MWEILNELGRRKAWEYILWFWVPQDWMLGSAVCFKKIIIKVKDVEKFQKVPNTFWPLHLPYK